MFKIIITIKDVLKPVVFTCNHDRDFITSMIEKYLTSDDLSIVFNDNDIFMCPEKSNIRSIVITKVDKND